MDLDQHEQDEQVQKWLRQNGSSLITGIAMGLALIFGWHWWQGKGVRHQEEAAGQYQAFTDALEAKDASKAKTLSAQITDKYGDTPFAELAVLRRAAALNAAGKSAEAIALLRAFKPKVKQADLGELMQLRLARLLLISGKADEAAKELATVAKPRYPEIASELRGDIAVARGQRDEARKAYQAALTRLDQAAPTRPLLELKLIDAGGNPPAKPES